MRGRHILLLEKSRRAASAAVEIYNKPGFDTREDLFCILLVQAWELLLKARILYENGNKLPSIQVFERSKTRGRRKIPRLNRAGNPMTIDISKAMEIVRQYANKNIDQTCIDNIGAAIEIRDNAVHFMNVDKALSAKVCQIGSACLMNYFTAIQQWFGVDLQEFGFMPLPLSFYPPEYLLCVDANPEGRSDQTSNLLRYLERIERQHEGAGKTPFHVALRLEVRFERGSKAEALPVRITKDPTAPEVRLSEQDFKDRYPWDYAKLRREIRKKISGIKLNARFNAAIKEIKEDPSCCMLRLLDPGNPRSSRKHFYSQRALSIFEKSWSKQ